MTLFMKFTLHMRMQEGSTYVYSITDETGRIVGTKTSWVAKLRFRVKKPDRITFKDLKGNEYPNARAFREAYEARLQQPEGNR